VVCGPIGCTVDFRCRLIHLKIILWNKPLEIGLCNKAYQNKIKKNILFKWLLVKKLIYVYCYMKLKDIKLMYRIEGLSLKK
ncbi:hypothetical protein ACK13Q_18000, partial [Acinetobacter baumannii]